MTENPERREALASINGRFQAPQLRCRQGSHPIADEQAEGGPKSEGDGEHLPEILTQAEEELEEARRQKQADQILSSRLVDAGGGQMEADDVFEICEEEEANFGQSSTNLQIREIFLLLRRQIEKLFDEEEISMSVLCCLPSSLQDDFLELTAYVREKIDQIRSHNEISFIMAEPGNEPDQADDCSLELPGYEEELQRALSEKDALINSLMNDNQCHENTIHQLTMEKEEIEEENENKFMRQFNIYKEEIRQQKKQMDAYEMNFQSLANILKNVLEIYSDPDEREDDFRDNMTMFARLANLAEREHLRISQYIYRYLQMKGIE